MTDQFFGTFLIPTITRTDPHYHRRPDLSIPRRILHCVDQIAWQRDENGSDSINYSQIVAPVFDIAISNLYVPTCRRTSAPMPSGTASTSPLRPSTTSLPSSCPRSPAASTPTWSLYSESSTRWPPIHRSRRAPQTRRSPPHSRPGSRHPARHQPCGKGGQHGAVRRARPDDRRRAR